MASREIKTDRISERLFSYYTGQPTLSYSTIRVWWPTGMERVIAFFQSSQHAAQGRLRV